ncbi:uncharacterized protein LOC142776968 [Rhipicephalus microplus]|uniref:uncharacterized protein LOC142776968 n=1 Tax=Rhipicephalus microplus TaxID=6941 RepID=UPI003F6ADBF0
MPKGRHRHCYAPGCRTGYSGVKAEKQLSLFSVPKDEARRALWEKNLHRSDKLLDSKCAVCELHFDKRYIQRDYVHIVNGKEVRIERGTPALTSDAVPTVLPNAPKYLSSTAPPKRAPRKRETPAKLDDTKRKRKKVESPCSTAAVEEPFESDGFDSPVLGADNLCNLSTPSAYWSSHRFTNFEGTVYALGELVESTGTVNSDRSVLFSVSKDQEVSFRTFLAGKLITEGRVETVREAEGVLLRASGLLKCPGAMSTSAIIAEELTKSLLKKKKNSRHWRRFLQPEMRSNDSDRRSSLPVLSVPSKGSSHKNVLAQVPSPKASEDSCPEAEVNLAKAQAPF